ncbi:hypothetical protein FRUB_00297 [Fimbriiglobus ruber]|uniref:Uncharacterized protein n=1 Tax=Fimbriiglobus ruber TaxID=1908690 RepID=A0A225E723_9BACT|nr:hypothetical protein FRUB_00297 [Fimbriiglobus ruber]
MKLVEDLLGTTPKNQNIYRDFVASKAVDMGLVDEEAATVEDLDEVEARGWTGFMRDDEGHFIYNYAVKGFLCESARTLKQFGAMKQLKDKFKRSVFVWPRRIRLPDPTEVLERPLRAETPLGPRVALTRSDVLKAGTVIEFELEVLDVLGVTEACVREVLSYGKFIGLGQWRTGGYGAFEVVEFVEI